MTHTILASSLKMIGERAAASSRNGDTHFTLTGPEFDMVLDGVMIAIGKGPDLMFEEMTKKMLKTVRYNSDNTVSIPHNFLSA